MVEGEPLAKQTLFKIWEERKQLQGIINGRLVHSSTVRQVVSNMITEYDYSSLHGCGEILDEKFQYSKYERKIRETKQKRISRGRLVLNLKIQQVSINLYTKYDYSSLRRCGEIFQEKFHYSKYGRKENTGKNKKERVGSQSHDTISRHQPAHQI